MKKMKTPYKKLTKENQRLWDTMKYLHNKDPDKYKIKKTYKCEYRYKIHGTGHYIYIHKIELFEKVKQKNHYPRGYYFDERRIMPAIELKSDHQFEGYERKI